MMSRLRLIEPYTQPTFEVVPLQIPAWLTDPESIGPCPCGKPIMSNQPYTILEGELFKRYFHIQCAQIHMAQTGEWSFSEDDWDDD